MPRPFAVFDIDGTIIRWQLYHALADELASLRIDREGRGEPRILSHKAILDLI